MSSTQLPFDQLGGFSFRGSPASELVHRGTSFLLARKFTTATSKPPATRLANNIALVFAALLHYQELRRTPELFDSLIPHKHYHLHGRVAEAIQEYLVSARKRHRQNMTDSQLSVTHNPLTRLVDEWIQVTERDIRRSPREVSSQQLSTLEREFDQWMHRGYLMDLGSRNRPWLALQPQRSAQAPTAQPQLVVHGTKRPGSGTDSGSAAKRQKTGLLPVDRVREEHLGQERGDQAMIRPAHVDLEARLLSIENQIVDHVSQRNRDTAAMNGWTEWHNEREATINAQSRLIKDLDARITAHEVKASVDLQNVAKDLNDLCAKLNAYKTHSQQQNTLANERFESGEANLVRVRVIVDQHEEHICELVTKLEDLIPRVEACKLRPPPGHLVAWILPPPQPEPPSLDDALDAAAFDIRRHLELISALHETEDHPSTDETTCCNVSDVINGLQASLRAMEGAL